MSGWLVGGGMRASSDPVLLCFAAESESAVHDGNTGMKEKSQTKTHRGAHTEVSGGGMFRSSALHLLIAIYNPGLPLCSVLTAE